MTQSADRLNPSELQEMKSMIGEMTRVMYEIKMKQEDKKAIADTIAEKFGIKKKIVNKIATAMFNQNYDDIRAENEHFEYLYESIQLKKDSEGN